jgi:hypothetical protein
MRHRDRSSACRHLTSGRLSGFANPMRATAAENTHADPDLVLQSSSIFSFWYDAHQVNWLIITSGETSRFSLEAAPVHSHSAMRRTPNSSSRFWLELQLLLLNRQRCFVLVYKTQSVQVRAEYTSIMRTQLVQCTRRASIFLADVGLSIHFCCEIIEGALI